MIVIFQVEPNAEQGLVEGYTVSEDEFHKFEGKTFVVENCCRLNVTPILL